jgi:hypothetical protein
LYALPGRSSSPASKYQKRSHVIDLAQLRTWQPRGAGPKRRDK